MSGAQSTVEVAGGDMSKKRISTHGLHKGKGMAVLTSGGDSQGISSFLARLGLDSF
jgi:hypothetical protein